jgi:hypothetical protein
MCHGLFDIYSKEALALERALFNSGIKLPRSRACIILGHNGRWLIRKNKKWYGRQNILDQVKFQYLYFAGSGINPYARKYYFLADKTSLQGTKYIFVHLPRAAAVISLLIMSVKWAGLWCKRTLEQGTHYFWRKPYFCVAWTSIL